MLDCSSEGSLAPTHDAPSVSSEPFLVTQNRMMTQLARTPVVFIPTRRNEGDGRCTASLHVWAVYGTVHAILAAKIQSVSLPVTCSGGSFERQR